MPGKPGLWIQRSFALCFQKLCLIASRLCRVMHRVALRSLHEHGASCREAAGSVLSKYKPSALETTAGFLEGPNLLWSYQHEAGIVKPQIIMDSSQQHGSFIIPCLFFKSKTLTQKVYSS